MEEIFVTFDNHTISLTLTSCLLCMKNQGDIPVTMQWMKQPQTLSEMIMDVTNITISDPPDDNYPSNICQTCATKIVDFFTFKLETETANALLNHILNDMKEQHALTKVENADIESNEMIVERLDMEPNDEMIVESLDITPNDEMFVESIEPDLDTMDIKNESENEETKYDDRFDADSESESEFEFESQFEPESEIIVPIRRPCSPYKPKLITSKCDYCNEDFKYGTLQNHIKNDHPDGKFQCEDCPKIYRTKKSLMKHRNIHLEKTIMCEICSFMCLNVNELNAHTLTHGQSFNCDSCGKSFWDKDEFDLHVQKHKCTICDKSFLKTRDYNKHMRIHTGKSLFECPHCDLTFTNNWFYRIHIRNHNREGLICKICFRKISSAGRLATHCLRVHLDETKDFDCMICDEVLTTRDELKNHLFIHNRRLIHKSDQIVQRKRYYKCKYCDEKFFSNIKRDTHAREQHLDEKPPQCLICHKTFTCHKTISSHMKNVHNLI